MARGQPDFGMYAAYSHLISLADMAELAARLDSIVLFDRRGKVALLDNFESTVLKWSTSTSGTGAIALDSTYPKSGSQDVKLSHDATGGRATMTKGFALLSSARCGTEITFIQASNKSALQIRVDYYDETNQYKAYIKIDFNALTISYWNSSGTWTQLATFISCAAYAFIYIPIKLVVDFSTGKYIKFIFGATEYNMSTIAMQSVADTTWGRITVTYQLDHVVLAAGQIYLDDFIFTQDEP